MPKTICLIDDEEEILTEMSHWLKDQGYQVIAASSGPAAVEKIQKQRPNLIILDIIMPVMTGFDVLRELKKNQQTHSIPVIMLTAKGETSTIMQAQQSHAVDYFIKPFDQAELLKSIKKHII